MCVCVLGAQLCASRLERLCLGRQLSEKLGPTSLAIEQTNDVQSRRPNVKRKTHQPTHSIYYESLSSDFVAHQMMFANARHLNLRISSTYRDILPVAIVYLPSCTAYDVRIRDTVKVQAVCVTTRNQENHFAHIPFHTAKGACALRSTEQRSKPNTLELAI